MFVDAFVFNISMFSWLKGLNSNSVLWVSEAWKIRVFVAGD